MAFGKEIKRLRSKAGWSAQKLADVLGVKAERLRKWEQFDSTPKENDKKIIEDKFGVPINSLHSLDVLPNFKDASKKMFETPNEYALLIKDQVEMLAMQRVTLAVLAEVQAKLMGDKVFVSQLLSSYRKLVADEKDRILTELTQPV
jgi:transcriptional regulator with XRE-family HTH domain